MIPKSLVQFFFGATNQDTSKKGVKQGDLITAKNTWQLHAGEFIKRPGFTIMPHTYTGQSVPFVPDSITSPDGVTTVVRNPDTDTVFAQSSDVNTSQPMGASLRLMPTVTPRFQALGSGDQAAPMAKQAGDFYVYLKDSSTFVVARRSSDSEAELASRTVVANGPGINIGGTVTPASTHVGSFSVIDVATFDASNLWIFWVDDSTNGLPNGGLQQNRDGIWAIKVPHDLVSTPTSYAIRGGTQTNLMLTGISASITGDGLLTVAACGVHPSIDAPGVTTHDNYSNFLAYGANCSRVDAFLVAEKVSNAGASTWESTTTRDSTASGWTSSGVCLLTVNTIAANAEGHFYCAFWAPNASSAVSSDLVIADVLEGTGNVGELGGVLPQTWTILTTVTNAGYRYDPVGLPKPFFLGSVTGREWSYGVGDFGAIVAAQYRIYYQPNLTLPLFFDPVDTYSDRLYTRAFSWYTNGTPTSLLWATSQGRGAWLAQGWFKAPDGTDLIITGWEDPDGIQVPYHLRRLDTGAILAQFAYGNGPHAGGCSTGNSQIAGRVADVAQPMLATAGVGSGNQILLAMQSANITGSVDIANVTFAKPAYQQPAVFGSFALSPGPVPTIVSGWQRLQEAGPLVYPSRLETAFGVGST